MLEDSESRGGRRFFRCGVCRLILVGSTDLPDLAAEKSRYLEHNNEVHDPDYRTFLARLWDRVKPLLTPRASGLDYGAGPGPALVAMMREDGFEVEGYDPIFDPDTKALERTYDFIVCTETAEHMHRPGDELSRLDGMLRPGGLLGVMTSFVDASDSPEGLAAFKNWYYRRDPTHVAFYSAATMEWIAGHMGWQLELPAKNIAIFRKQPI